MYDANTAAHLDHAREQLQRARADPQALAVPELVDMLAREVARLEHENAARTAFGCKP